VIVFLPENGHRNGDSPIGLARVAQSGKEHNNNSISTVGWRPTRQWIQECVDRQQQQQQQQLDRIEPFQIAWRGYTLGDCVLMCYKCRISIRSSPLRKESFAGQYLQQACPKGGIRFINNQTRVHWPTLEAILKQSPYGDRPPDNGIVLHLRLGDVIEHANASVIDMLWEGGNPAHHAKYSNSIKSISEYLGNVEEAVALIQRNDSNITTIPVILRGGAHFHVYYKSRDQRVAARKSRTYVNCLKEALEQADGGRGPVQWNISMVVDGPTPDQDFYYCSHAKYFVVSTGGYSKLMGQMVMRLGGHVIGRTFT
jgi:hypothetical protein